MRVVNKKECPKTKALATASRTPCHLSALIHMSLEYLNINIWVHCRRYHPPILDGDEVATLEGGKLVGH